MNVSHMENSKDGQVRSFIENYFSSKLGAAELAAIPNWQESLLESGVLDSFGIMELVVALEKEFGVQIKDDQISFDNFRSCSALAKLVSGN